MDRALRHAAGFTLIETIFALAIMAGGLLSLAAVFSAGLVHLNSGNSLMVAKVKAAEAIESVFMSRDTGVISWDQVRNQSAGGVFTNAAQPIRDPVAPTAWSTQATTELWRPSRCLAPTVSLAPRTTTSSRWTASPVRSRSATSTRTCARFG